ncbi:MAG: hypothetical protein EOM15_00235 [Spirochaetia bacterium]|nr:hypothetical protein [Spirochaetia bacterium]
MKRITLKDFRWLRKPDTFEKNHRQVTLEVDHSMRLPQGPLLLAISDEPFIMKASLSVPDPNAFCGVCVYHLDSTYVAAGLSQDMLELQSSIHNNRVTSKIPFTCEQKEARWYLQRCGANMEIGLLGKEDQKATVFTSFTLAPAEDSISFGFYFSNETAEKKNMRLHSLSYTLILA